MIITDVIRLDNGRTDINPELHRVFSRTLERGLQHIGQQQHFAHIDSAYPDHDLVTCLGQIDDSLASETCLYQTSPCWRTLKE
jgi:hypothetical protein